MNNAIKLAQNKMHYLLEYRYLVLVFNKIYTV